MRLKDYRDLLNVSRRLAAQQLGVSNVTVWRWENGLAYPSVKACTRIVEWSKGAVTRDDLLVGGKP